MVPTLFGLSIYSVQAVCNSCPKFGLAPQTRFTSKILCHLNLANNLHPLSQDAGFCIKNLTPHPQKGYQTANRPKF